MEKNNGITEDVTDETVTEAPLDGVDGDKPKKKKKKKDKNKDREAHEDSTLEDSQLNDSVNPELTDVNSNGHVEKKKKKKKKDKSQEIGGDESTPLTELPGSDSSGYLSDKGNRKRKESDELNDINDALEKPISKKKRNK